MYKRHIREICYCIPCSIHLEPYTCQSLAVFCLSNPYKIHSYISPTEPLCWTLYSTPASLSVPMWSGATDKKSTLECCCQQDLAAKHFLWAAQCSVHYVQYSVIHIWVWSNGGDEKSTLVGAVNTLPLPTWLGKSRTVHFCLHLNRTEQNCPVKFYLFSTHLYALCSVRYSVSLKTAIFCYKLSFVCTFRLEVAYKPSNTQKGIFKSRFWCW